MCEKEASRLCADAVATSPSNIAAWQSRILNLLQFRLMMPTLVDFLDEVAPSVALEHLAFLRDQVVFKTHRFATMYAQPQSLQAVAVLQSLARLSNDRSVTEQLELQAVRLLKATPAQYNLSNLPDMVESILDGATL
ncbi:MAG: hypothetical protein MHM6MM_001312 [Cercozoa sp. M6MM]